MFPSLETVIGLLVNSAHEYCHYTGSTLLPEGVLSPKLYVDVPARPQTWDFFYTSFLHNHPPICISFLKEIHLILLKLGAFLP